MMSAVDQLAPTIGIAPACEAFGLPRASFYRRPIIGPMPLKIRPSPARALTLDERSIVRGVLNSMRFQDCAPAAIQATLGIV